MTRHQYGISALISQTPFRAETSGDVAKRRLFSQATEIQNLNLLNKSFYSYPVHTLCRMLKQGTFFSLIDAV